MRESDLVIGNSSSGIIEAPFLKTPTVNIGDRQKGRLKASSVVESLEKKSEIIAAIQKALSEEFYDEIQKTQPLYGNGDVGLKIKEVLRSVVVDIRKSFFDIDLGN
jgi:UDP-N-acetylglucosamine 2-epimerase (non-hydrolysing)/GDP/UDP-N,N'-diacetylbacillosamine 2-epimerase (hydrolysing)